MKRQFSKPVKNWNETDYTSDKGKRAIRRENQKLAKIKTLKGGK